MESFTKEADGVVVAAQREAKFLGHKKVRTLHILLGLVGEKSGGLASEILRSAGVSLNVTRKQVEKLCGGRDKTGGLGFVRLKFTEEARNVLLVSLREAKLHGRDKVDTVDLLWGLLLVSDVVVPRLLENQGADMNKIREEVIRQVGGQPEEIPSLDNFGTNLTTLAQEGKLHPFVGRQEQLEHVIQIICRRMKNNPCLVGEPGVGKSAIIEGLAQRILSGSVPERLKGKKVIKVDVANFFNLTQSQGTSKDRTKFIFEEAEKRGDVILFVKNVESIFEPTSLGAHNFAHILKHALDRGVIQCIFAATVNEHRKHIENDALLKRIVQSVKVPEPSVEETIQILEGLRATYETHYKLQYTDEALVAAAKLSQQYICDRFLPEKAIDLIDEAGSYVQLSQTMAEERHEINALSVTKIHIQHVVSTCTGVPVRDVSKEESCNLLKLEETLHKYVIGQNEAINSVCRAIRRARVGLRNSRRPIASFMFTGPSGVGKTELAKALASHYFGSEYALIRYDMSEYMDRSTASRLIGAPPGYIGFNEGGQLTEAVRNRPHAVVLFDEIEKAHSDVFNLMLQVLEDGRLTDGKGLTVDFKSTLVIMTSNVGNNIIVGKSGEIETKQVVDNYDNDDSFDHIKNLLVIEQVKKNFRPEFLNRFDDIIVFKQLTMLEVEQIANIMLREVILGLKAKDVHLSVTCRFRDHLVEQGYDPSYGARPLRRTIQRMLEDTLVDKMLMKEIKEGDSVVVDISIEGNVVVLNQNNAPKEGVCVDSNGNNVANEKRENMVGTSSNLVGKLLDLQDYRKTP